jgi:hypothetical protein
MSSAFDPYYKWLAIPPAEQPPNHYRLLALNLFESDADVIATAADQRMAHVRSFQSGQYVDASQRLLNELASARICLLKPEKKSAYDAALRAKIAEQTARTAPPAPPPMIAAPVPATLLTAAPIAQSPPPTFPSRQDTASPVQLVEVERPMPAQANPAQLNPVQPAAAAPAADWHDELDLLGLSVGGDHNAKRSTVARSRKPALPKIFFLGPLAGIAAVIAAVTYTNIRDAMEQQANDNASGRTGKSIKRPIETSLHTGGPGGKYGVGSAKSRPGSNFTPQFPANDDSASSTVSDGSQPPQGKPTPPNDGSSATHADEKPVAAAARVPVPDAEEQRKTLVEIKKVFKDEFAKATTIEGRKALAKKLGEEALTTKNDPTTRYVLATQSLENAVKLGDAKLASGLVKGLTDYYDIDSWELKAKTLSQLAAVAKTVEARELIASGAYDLVDKALAEERYDAAVQLANCAADLTAMLPDNAFRKKTHEARARAHRMQQEAAEVQTAQERLAVQSDDAAAHLLIGRFFCMERDDWDSGLPHLVRGSDAELSAIARQELAGAAKTADQMALADAWWDLADHRREGPDLPLVKGMRNRAVYWYRRAMPQLSGFAQAKAQKRIAEATAITPAKP